MADEEFQELKWELIEGVPRDPKAIEALGEEEAEKRRYGLEQLLDLVRPFIQVDGGDLVLKSADYVDGIIEVELQGAVAPVRSRR